jgi:hypothetical protein
VFPDARETASRGSDARSGRLQKRKTGSMDEHVHTHPLGAREIEDRTAATTVAVAMRDRERRAGVSGKPTGRPADTTASGDVAEVSRSSKLGTSPTAGPLLRFVGGCFSPALSRAGRPCPPSGRSQPRGRLPRSSPRCRCRWRISWGPQRVSEGEGFEVGLIVLVDERAEPSVTVVDDHADVVGRGARRSCRGEGTDYDADGREAVFEVDAEHEAPSLGVRIERYDPRGVRKVGRISGAGIPVRGVARRRIVEAPVASR